MSRNINSMILRSVITSIVMIVPGVNQLSAADDIINNIDTGFLEFSRKIQVLSGDESYGFFGPNNVSSGSLFVGATSNRIVGQSAQVISTNGNLHLDSAPTSYSTYINYYSQRPTLINALGGNVGIGTAAPTAKLYLAGSGLITSDLQINGTGTFAGLRLSSGASSNFILASDASGNARWVSTGSLVTESDPQVGTMTTGYIPRWNGSSLNNGTIFDTGTGVGIGTINPYGRLHVGGEIIGDALGVGSGQFRAVSGPYGFFMRNDGTNIFSLLTNSGSPYGTWNSLRPMTINAAAGDVYFVNNGVMMRHSDGNVGIGNTGPTAKLHVTTTGTGTDGIFVSEFPSGRNIALRPNNTAGAANTLVQLGDASLIYGGSGVDAGAITIGPWSLGAKGMRIDPAGKVGIGTATPSTNLNIYGFANSPQGVSTWNGGTGSNAMSFYQLGSSASNSWVNALLNDNSGIPYFQLVAGVGVSYSYFNMPNYSFQSNTGTNWLNITSAGNVGIGEPSPLTKLHVNGNASFSGTISANTPTASNHVATKAYVDAAVSAQAGGRKIKKVFITAGIWNGNLGGLSGADAKCQNEATSAGLPGTYKALVSTSTENAITRLGYNWDILVNVKGLPIRLFEPTYYDNNLGYYPGPWSPIQNIALNGRWQVLISPINMTATGAEIFYNDVFPHTGGLIITGTNHVGLRTGYLCNDFTDGTGAGQIYGGIVTGTEFGYGTNWNGTNISASCVHSVFRLYCFEDN